MRHHKTTAACTLLLLSIGLPAAAASDNIVKATSTPDSSVFDTALLQIRDERLQNESTALAVRFSRNWQQGWSLNAAVTGAQHGFAENQQDYLQTELGLSYRFVHLRLQNRAKTSALSGELKLGNEHFSGLVADNQQYLSAALVWHSERDSGWYSSFKWGYLADNGPAELSRQGAFVEFTEGYRLTEHSVLALEYKNFQRQNSLGLSLRVQF